MGAEVKTLVIDHGGNAARLGSLQRLHPNYVGAQIGQQAGAHLGLTVRKLDDTKPFKRQFNR
ncbi:hypothetical protein D3C86_2213090 [compost metagenome]